MTKHWNINQFWLLNCYFSHISLKPPSSPHNSLLLFFMFPYGPHKLYHIPIWFNPLLLFIIIHLFTLFKFFYSTHMCNIYLVPLILCTIYIVQDKALHTHLQQKPQKPLDGFNLFQLSTHIHLSLYSSFHIKIGPLPLTISFNHTLISNPCAISHATF